MHEISQRISYTAQGIDLITHKVINGVCYLYEQTTKYKGKCKQHNKEKEK